MKRLLFLMGLVGALLVPGTTWATDGDACALTADGAAITLPSKGSWIPVACIQLCDGKAATEECAEYDFADAPGMPDIIVLEYEEEVGSACGATPDITITTGPVTGQTPEYAIDTSSVVLNSTTNRVVIDTSVAPLDRFLFTTTTDDASCVAGDLDVRMTFFNRKNRL